MLLTYTIFAIAAGAEQATTSLVAVVLVALQSTSAVILFLWGELAYWETRFSPYSRVPSGPPPVVSGPRRRILSPFLLHFANGFILAFWVMLGFERVLGLSFGSLMKTELGFLFLMTAATTSALLDLSLQRTFWDAHLRDHLYPAVDLDGATE